MSDMSALGSLYTSDYWKSVTQTKELENTLASDKTTKSKEELMGVCKDFEAYFVEQMLKAMKKMVPENEESKNEYTDMFGDMMYQEYAQMAVKQQDFGIANTLYEQMKRNYGLD